MDNYETVCESNRHLFEQLELLTTQIGFCATNNHIEDINVLRYKKENIRKLINTNLDKLELIWKREKQVRATEIEIQIIKMYLENPNLTASKIAEYHSCSYGTVGVVLTKLLNKRYLGY